jgi:hypothetical protein
MKVDSKVLAILNQIYKEILLRPVDEEGIKNYSKYIPYRENYIRQSLLKSKEYLNFKNQNNTKSHKNNINLFTKCNFIKGETFTEKKIDISKKKILVLTLIKNCAENNTFQVIQNFFQELSGKFHSVYFAALTNNNTDNSSELLSMWQKNNPNIFIIEHHNETINTIQNNSCGNRINKLAEYRSILLDQSIKYFKDDIDYIIVFDSDVIFDTKKITISIIESLSINTTWSAISANNCFDKSNIHYDVLALRLKDQPIDISQIYPHFTTFYGKNHKWNNQSYILNNFVEVKSAFGGLTIYDAKEISKLCKKNCEMYNMESFPDCTCEHISLDLKLKNKHYINSKMKLPSNGSLEGQMYGSPVLFLPRDAGFFSVFNFLIGTMGRGIRAYPYFNKELFLKNNRGVNKQFCYWTNQENAWFDFFEPISYYEEDTEHTDKSFLSYGISSGEDAPEEFKTPRVFKELLQNNDDIFRLWRHNTHNIYDQYIKFQPHILKTSNDIFTDMFENNSFVIGLHYRHPSHSVESGEIFIQQYYEAIDKILSQHPDAEIFLATDTEFGLMVFTHKYGDRIKYIKDTIRLPVDNILEWAYALNNIGKSDTVGLIKGRGYELHQNNIHNNPNFNYREMTNTLLYEILCLSKCNALINSTSNMSLALSYINPNIPIITL